jgi:hypothetical protein
LEVDAEAPYESSARAWHSDFALRYTHDLFGLHYFNGTSREPLLELSDNGRELRAYYQQIQQVGIDVQYTDEAWLWKFESILREGQGGTFAAATFGFEYTYYQIFESSADLGVLVEYHVDERDEDKAPATIYNNDIFLGMRLALNDTQDTQALLGLMLDTEDKSTMLSFEANRRLTNNLFLKLEASFFLNTDARNTLATIENDDFVNVSLELHF